MAPSRPSSKMVNIDFDLSEPSPGLHTSDFEAASTVARLCVLQFSYKLGNEAMHACERPSNTRGYRSAGTISWLLAQKCQSPESRLRRGNFSPLGSVAIFGSDQGAMLEASTHHRPDILPSSRWPFRWPGRQARRTETADTQKTRAPKNSMFFGALRVITLDFSTS